MRIFTYIALVLILVTGFACNKEGAGCLNGSGDIETVFLDLPEFTEVDISSNIEVHLSSGPGTAVSLTTGKNLIPGIRVEVIDGVLYLDNLNKCNFVRTYTSPVVTIANPDLQVVTQHGFGKVLSVDTLVYDKLSLISLDGSGDFEVKVDCQTLVLGSNNIANFYVAGKAKVLRASISWSDGMFFCKDLMANSCYVNNSGSNTMHLNVIAGITGSINNLGNVILHKQMPPVVDVVETSEGRLLFQP